MMKELSLNILDIVQNSIRANASLVNIDIAEDAEQLSFKVKDNGCGMTKEQVARLVDPFFTSRTTRKVGLGIPFLRMAAELTGGEVKVDSVPESESIHHGTEVYARFCKTSIDCMPLGDIVETLCTLIQGCPDVDIEFTHAVNNNQVVLSTAQMREVLGENVPLNSFEVLEWIEQYLDEQYKNL